MGRHMGALATLVGIIVSAMFVIQGATLRYVISIEHRLTRLEVLAETRSSTESTPTSGTALAAGGTTWSCR